MIQIVIGTVLLIIAAIIIAVIMYAKKHAEEDIYWRSISKVNPAVSAIPAALAVTIVASGCLRLLLFCSLQLVPTRAIS